MYLTTIFLTTMHLTPMYQKRLTDNQQQHNDAPSISHSAIIRLKSTIPFNPMIGLLYGLLLTVLWFVAILSPAYAADTTDKQTQSVKTNQTDKPVWSKTAVSDLANYEVQLDCAQKPSVGEFQNCNVTVTKRAGANTSVKTASNKQLSTENTSDQNQSFSQIPTLKVDGGMLAHGHGLPTAPIATPISEDQYAIRGLKYNMPGFWFLKFEIAETGKQPEVTLFALDVPNKAR